MKKIGIIVGSLRKDSYNRKLAEVVAEELPEDYSVEFVSIKDLPMYNEDIDGEKPPKEYAEFREKIAEKDGFIIATPEYNRSMPACLKNALDVGSRPYGANKWAGKPVGILSASPGGMGGMGANMAIRQPMICLNMIPLQQPETYLGNITKSFDENGKVSDRTRAVLRKFAEAFVRHVDRF